METSYLDMHHANVPLDELGKLENKYSKSAPKMCIGNLTHKISDSLDALYR